MRSPLIVTSVGVHIAVVSAFLVGGLWRLERLDAERRPVDIAVAAPPPPAPSGSPAAAPLAEPFKKKQRTITKALVQPTEPDHDTKPIVTADASPLGTGGTGSGAGSGSGTDPTGTGTCTDAACGPATPQPTPPQPPVVGPVVVPPAVIKGLRISGETQVHPPAPVKTAIARDGKDKVVATYRVCSGTDGRVTATTALKSSGYVGYDSVIERTLRTWRYRPYEVDGRRVPVCGVVTFIYSLH